MGFQKASDNSSQFKSETFKIFTKMNNIKHIFTPPYHSKANGLAKNGVRNFKNVLNNPPWRQTKVKKWIGRHVYTVDTNTTNASSSTTWTRHVEQI
jgi:transposase InsO family protein